MRLQHERTGRDDPGWSTRGRYRHDARLSFSEVHRVVIPPAHAGGSVRLRLLQLMDRLRRAARDPDLANLTGRPETDPLTVGREDDPGRVLGAGQHGPLQLVHPADGDRGRGPGGDARERRDVASIGRDRDVGPLNGASHAPRGHRIERACDHWCARPRW